MRAIAGMTTLLLLLAALDDGVFGQGVDQPAPAGNTPAIDQKARSLDPEFARWAAKSERHSYRDTAKRFLQAAGRSSDNYEQLMSELAAQVIAETEAPVDPKQSTGLADRRCRALAQALFGKGQVVASTDLSNLDNLFPDRILARKQGYCVGLALICVDLGERLGWPLVPVAAPRHVYVRYQDGPNSRNFETTLSGASHPDRWYRDRFRLPGKSAPLSSRHFIAHLINNYGYSLLQQGHRTVAMGEFKSALTLDPKLTEALVNVGVAHGLGGDFAKARKAFEVAHQRWPDDVQVELNRLEAWLATGETQEECVQTILKLAASEPQLDLVELLKRARSRLDAREDWDRVQVLTEQIATRQLARGQKAGILGRYFGGQNFEKEVRTRIDPELAFNWGWRSPFRGLPRDNFSVRWEGFLNIPAADEYTFLFFCSDGVRLWVDGRPIINAWTRTVENIAQEKITLRAGWHEIRVDYFEANGDAGMLMMLAAEKQSDMLEVPKMLFVPTPRK